ncbi:hypothetical protein ACWC5G_35535, partial [Streptomyces sp. NPDC001274]
MAAMTTPPPPPPAYAADPAAARRSLEALALGDAFGERWAPLFREPRRAAAEIRARHTPDEPVWPPPWSARAPCSPPWPPCCPRRSRCASGRS